VAPSLTTWDLFAIIQLGASSGECVVNAFQVASTCNYYNPQPQNLTGPSHHHPLPTEISRHPFRRKTKRGLFGII